MSEDTEKPNAVIGVIALLGALIVLLGLMYVVRPWFHTIIYGLLFSAPELLALVVFTSVAGIATYATTRSTTATGTVVSIVFVVMIAGVLLGGAYSQQTTAENLEFTETDNLPDANADQPRILPQTVADQYAQNTLQLPQHHLSQGDITMVDGTPQWSYAAEPEGLINSWRISQQGGVFVDMTTTQTSVSNVDNEMENGMGMAFNDNYKWNAVKNNYWTSYQDPYLVPHDDELYIAVPTIDHNHHIGNPLEGQVPIVYSTPEWGGVTLLGEDGSVEHLSPEEAQNHEVLEGQRLYPFDLAEYEVESQAYKNGIINAWFIHEDQLELASTGEGNSQPFMTVNEDGSLSYLSAAEPYGDAAGVYQIWMHDGRTGEIQQNYLGDGDALVGPDRSTNYVEQAVPQLREDMRMVEPLPVVVDDTLYWMVRVVPSESTGVAFNAFVNSETTDVLLFTEDEEIYDFLAGEVGEEDVAVDGGEEAPDGSNTITVIVVEDGMPVGEVEIDADSDWGIEVERGEEFTEEE